MSYTEITSGEFNSVQFASPSFRTLQSAKIHLNVLSANLASLKNITSTTNDNSAYFNAQITSLSSSISSINTLLASDDTSYDTLQEVVTAFKALDSAIGALLENSLTSTSTTKALTAAQGKILKDAADALSSSVSSLSTTVSGHTTTISSHTSSISSHTSSIATLSSDVSTLSGDVDSIDTRVTALESVNLPTVLVNNSVIAHTIANDAKFYYGSSANITIKLTGFLGGAVDKKFLIKNEMGATISFIDANDDPLDIYDQANLSAPSGQSVNIAGNIVIFYDFSEDKFITL